MSQKKSMWCFFLFMYENLWFSDVFRGYKKRPVNWNGLNRIAPGFLCEKTLLKIFHDRKGISKFSHIYGYSRIWVTTKVRLSLFEKILITESGARRRSSCRSSHRRCSVRKGAFRNFAKLTGKHLCQGLFFNKDAGLRPDFRLYNVLTNEKNIWNFHKSC